MWTCDKCNIDFEAYPGLVTSAFINGIWQSYQVCDCGGRRILKSSQQSAQQTVCQYEHVLPDGVNEYICDGCGTHVRRL